MEGAPKTEMMPAVDQAESGESYAEMVTEARERLAGLKVYEGQIIVDREVWTAVESEAANLSTMLAAIPEEIRVANQLPGGRIYAPAANDEKVALAA